MKHSKILFNFLLFLSFLSVEYPDAIAANGNSSEKANAPLYDWAIIGENGLIYITPHKGNYIVDDEDYEFYFPEKFGVIDRTGKTIVDGKKRWMKKVNESENYSVYGEKGLGEGIMDKNFKVILPASAKHEIEVFDKYAAIKKPKLGIIEIMDIPTKKVLGKIPAKYDVDDIGDSMVLVHDKMNNSCFYNISGQLVISPRKLSEYSMVFGFREGRAMVIDDREKAGFIDKKANLVIPCKYHVELYEMDPKYSFFSNGIATLGDKDTGQMGAIDLNGKTVIPFNYLWIDQFNGKTSVARNSDFITFVELDTKGNIVKQLPDNYWDYSSGLKEYTDEESELIGFKNFQDEIVIPAKFTMVENFIGDLALVRYNYGVALINTKGEILLQNLSRWSRLDMPG